MSRLEVFALLFMVAFKDNSRLPFLIIGQIFRGFERSSSSGMAGTLAASELHEGQPTNDHQPVADIADNGANGSNIAPTLFGE